jgi:hypothetical protein
MTRTGTALTAQRNVAVVNGTFARINEGAI